MKRCMSYLAAIYFLLSVNISADLINPATLVIKETARSNFQIVFTLPIIGGKVLKARPVLPDVLVIEGDLQEKSIAGSVIRTWIAKCDPQDLIGAAVGVNGLLGTSQQIQLTVETLDGRKYAEVLLPTKAYFIIPAPPSFFTIVFKSTLKGMELVFNRPELVILVMLLLFLKLDFKKLIWGITAFAMAQSAGQWLAAQYWLVMSKYLPAAFTALTALMFTYDLIRQDKDSEAGWHKPAWLVLLLTGFIYGASDPQTDFIKGLTYIGDYLASLFTAAGAALGFIIIMLLIKEFRILTEVYSKEHSEKVIYYFINVLGIISASILLYKMSTPFFIVSSEPTIPIFVLIATVALGVWFKLKSDSVGAKLSFVLIVSATAGIILSFNGVILPLTTLVVFGFPAFLGITILIKNNLPIWIAVIVFIAGLLFTGNYAGYLLQNYSSLPIANSVGMTALLIIVFYISYRLAPDNSGHLIDRRITLISGSAAVLLAFIWRLIEYNNWFKAELASNISMGFIPFPLITLILLIAAFTLRPRKRKFKLAGDDDKEIRHWVMLITAFFVLPLGTVQIGNPFFSPGAPSSTEASFIMEKLLSGTYLAFNREDEDDAFDQLEYNLSDDLVADVYLDSRRRLSAGTRQGATITVRDVRVISVDSLKSNFKSERSYTYPCKWVVTARVKHLKHIHDRQNIYYGDLTIRVEDKKWKITKLVLKREEREILPYQSSS